MQADWLTLFYIFAQIFAVKAETLKNKKNGAVLYYSLVALRNVAAVVLGYGLLSQMFPFLKWRKSTITLNWELQSFIF